MKVLVTGASGFVGAHCLATLAARGHRATAALLAHEDEAAVRRSVGDLGATVAEVARIDWTDSGSLGALLAGHDAVLHLAGWMRGDDPARYQAGNPGLVEALLNAPGWRAEHRLLVLSSVAAVGPGTEDAPPDESTTAAPVGLYGRSKRAAEELALESPAPGHRLIIRAPSVYGPGDPAFLDAFRLAARGWYPALGPASMRFQLVYAPDLAKALVRALVRLGEEPSLPSLLHLGNPAVLTHAAWAKCFSEVTGSPVQVLALGRWGTTALGWWGWLKEALGLGPELVCRDKARHLLAGDWVHSFERAEEYLGPPRWTPHGAATRATLEWYQARGFDSG